MDYRQAGVDVEAGRAFVDRIRGIVAQTHRPGVLGGIGGFGGLFELPAGYRQPVLVSGADGVGTKLKVARLCDRHDTVGIDLVAMCANDVLAQGAEPLFFLDYIATGKLEQDVLAAVVQGIAAGCQQAGCALLGGETAEMPGFYAPGDYDLAGFCVGIAEKAKLLDGSQPRVGDAIVGLASSGAHSNGFSLIRKIVGDREAAWHAPFGDGSGGVTLGEILLTPTRIYVRDVLAAMEAGFDVRGLAHITGGGLPENLPRCLGAGQSPHLRAGSWEIPAIFSWLMAAGDVPIAEMYGTFNMGIGMALVVPPEEGDRLRQWFCDRGIPAWIVGEVVAGDGSVGGLPHG